MAGSGLVEGKVALVTGAASGIGRACALLLAAEGASGIVVADIDEDGGRATVAAVEAAGGAALFTRCDVSRSEDVQAMVSTAVATFGRLDCAINNAGISHPNARVAEVDEEAFDRVVAVNLKGTWLCMKHEIPVLKEAGGGSIVNTSSRAGLRGTAVAGVYAGTKHGVVGLTKSAAIGYAADHIRVNCICPGVVETGMIATISPERYEALKLMQPGGRVARPGEMAEAAVWLCSDRASFVSGVALPVDYTWTAGT